MAARPPEFSSMTWSSGLQLRVLRGNHQGLILPLQERHYLIGRAIDHHNSGPGRLFFHEPSVALVQAMLRWDEHSQGYCLQIESSAGLNSVSGIPLPAGVPRPVRCGSRLRMGNLVLALESIGGKALPVPKVEVELELPPPTPEPAPTQSPDLSHFHKTYQPRPGETIDGPLASFHPDGSLKSLCIYRRGKLSTTHARLDLEQGQQIGRVTAHDTECSFSQGMETVLIQFEGEVDFSQTPCSWETWVARWVGLICAGSIVNLEPLA